MPLLVKARSFLRNLFFTRRVDADLDQEVHSHLEMLVEEKIRAGMTRAEAQRGARIELGGVEQVKIHVRDSRTGAFLDSLVQDVRFAIRSLRRTAGLTAFVVITLALGIGMTSATFSMVDALIFRPYPVPHPGNVVALAGTTHDSMIEDFSYREYLDIRNKTKSYEGVIAYADMQAVGFSAEPGATPRIKGGMMVSGNFFHVLGADFWRHEFAADPTVVGRTVRLNGTPFTILGVAPDSFPGLLTFGHPDFYMPLAMARTFSTNIEKNFFEDRDDRELNVKARSKPDTSLQEARNELVVLAKDFERDYPKVTRGRGAAVYTQFQTRTIEDQNWKFGVVFVILALAVLLVACTNVAGLLLSRARERAREIA